MRIGILQTDSVRDEYRSAFGDYPSMFESLLQISAPGGTYFHVYDVQHGTYPRDIDDCDGYVITGSRESAYDDAPWIAALSRFIEQLHASRKRTVGICFGHQLIAQALGGETRAAQVGWGVGVHRMQIEETEDWMDPPRRAINLLSSHKDQVVRLPHQARLLGSSGFCPIGAFAVGEHFVTFQGHPEFRKEYAEALMRSREDMLGEAYGPGLASLSQETDEAVVGRWMINFLRA